MQQAHIFNWMLGLLYAFAHVFIKIHVFFAFVANDTAIFYWTKGGGGIVHSTICLLQRYLFSARHTGSTGQDNSALVSQKKRS
jgi:hypothetical protein